MEFTKQEAQLIQAALSGVKIGLEMPNYVELQAALKSAHDKCLAIIEADDETAKGKAA